MAKSKKKISIRKQKFINEILANTGSLAAAMVKAGYSKRTARNPKTVTETKEFKEAVDPFVEKMIKERDAAIARMHKIRSKAKYRDLTDSIDKMTKNIQLLTGGDTERKGIKISGILDSLDD